MKKLFLVAVLSALVSACSVGVGAGGGSELYPQGHRL